MNQSLTTEEIIENSSISEPFRGTCAHMCVPYYGKSPLQTTTRRIVRFPLGVVTRVQSAGISSGKFTMGWGEEKKLKVGVPFPPDQVQKSPIQINPFTTLHPKHTVKIPDPPGYEIIC
jgi:hypothetical protein